MRILLIGNFAPPYEEENLHNFTLLNQLKQEGNECDVINIAKPSRNEYRGVGTEKEDHEIINIKNYIDFIIKLIRHSCRSDVIHFLTKGYTRPGLMKLITSALIGKLLRARIIVTLHSELFSIFGRLRSKMGGQQLLSLSFFLADKIICGDRHTYEVALTHHKAKDKFAIIPSFIRLPKDIKESLKKLQDKKRVIAFSNVTYPSLLFEILNNMVAKYLDSDAGIAVSFSEENPEKLQHVIKEVVATRFRAGSRIADNMIFIEPADKQILAMVYTRADVVLRTLSCDGKTLFEDIALSLKKPMRSGNYLYFPTGLLLIKEGEVADLCAYIINNLMEKTEEPPEPPAEDFYVKIKEIYSK